MKKLLSLFILSLAFMTNAMAQELQGWMRDPTIKETHWFGQYEYLDAHPVRFISKDIHWSGNYLEYIQIVKDWTNDYTQRPVTSFYSWLDHKLRFSVDNTGAWTIDGVDNSAYYTDLWIQGDNNQWSNNRAYGQGLKNNTGNNQNFYIHNLKAGDEYTVTYYTNGGSAPTKVTAQATGTATVSIPGGAVIRCVEIKLAEYQASDFKVEEVSGQAAADLTNSHNQFLRSNGIYDAKFGTLGYKYSFKGPGVLEDKRGAVPYITMRFGNDNDMTFVRALSEPTVTYGDLATAEPKLYIKNYDGTNTNPTTPSDPNGNGEYVIHSGNNAPETWYSQFFISAPYSVPSGKTIHLKFKYKSDNNATVTSQAHSAPGTWLSNNGFENLSFTNEWKTFDADYTVQDNGWQTIAFNLNEDRYLATNFYFKDIELSIPERTEEISTDALGAASIIHEDNDLNPDHEHLQYRWTFRDTNYGNRFTEAQIRDRLVGKEWSTFTATHATNASSGAHPGSNGEWVNGVNYVYGDVFETIWPLCGNYFYFFPEVDGLLEIEYYAEGSNEITAFWYKQDADGNQLPGSGAGQPLQQFIHSNGQSNNNSFTDGGNNYKMMVNVKKGGIYFLCSLPTNMSHERPIFRLKSYTFIPIFRVEPLYKVVHNTEVNTTATQKVAEILGGPYTDLDGSTNTTYGRNEYYLEGEYTRNAEPEARVKCLGNVVSAKAKVEYENGKQYLSFYDIAFREGTNDLGEAYNPGGAVVAHVNNKEGQASFVLTIAYDAADAKWNDDKDTRIGATTAKEVKHWDFYSGKGDYITKRNGAISYNGATTGYTSEMNIGWDLGKYGTDDGTRYATNQSAWKAKSKIFKETHKADGLTADWEYDFVDVPNKIEPIYKSVYDMEADNADMIHETAGLVFFTEPNQLGVFNENDAPTSTYQDRFIGLMGGGKLIIPRLKANDRVVIKMGCFGNVEDKGDSQFEQKAVLWLKNAKDAMGNTIPTETDYIIGGSEPFDEPSDAKMYPHGEYHFIVANTSKSDAQDFTIQLKEGGLLKIYSIDIYRNAANNNKDILTENVVTGLEPEMLFTDGQADRDMTVYLRYSGWQEISEFNSLDQVRGNLDELSTTDFARTDNETQPYSTYASLFKNGDFGSFRAKMAVKTKDAGNTFVTDYAPGCIAVDYLVTQPYPYTWDFTDLVPESLGNANAAITAEKNRTAPDLLDDYNGWKVVDGENVTTGLRNAPEEEPGVLFANGGQIYASDKMFEESAGIGLKRSIDDPDDAELLNNSVNITADGLVLNSTSSEFHKLVIPQVDADAAIYVRATPISGATIKAQFSTDGETGESFDYTSTVGDDVIYAMQNDTKQDVELWLNGMTVKKIGVSRDPKTVNAKGWATESRDRVIDPELTAYLTGYDIETCLVTAFDKENRTVTLSRAYDPTAESNDALVMRSFTGNGQNGANIIHNIDNGEVKILNNGFHLFVPDMHDYIADRTDNFTNLKELTNGDSWRNLLVSQLEEGTIPMKETRTWKYSESDTGESLECTNYAMSYRYYVVDQEGEIIDPTIQSGDEAFYRIVKGGASSSANKGYLPLPTQDMQVNGRYANMFSVVYEGEETGIQDLKNAPAENVYYTIDGQMLNGVPTIRGIYIVNGKKVVIK